MRALPPRYGSSVIQNVLYFSSNNITTPIVVLVVYALIAAAVLGYVEWIRSPQGYRACRSKPAGSGKRANAGRARSGS